MTKDRMIPAELQNIQVKELVVGKADWLQAGPHMLYSSCS